MNAYENELWLLQNYYLFTETQIMGFQAVIDLQFLSRPEVTIHAARQKALEAVLRCEDF